MGFGGLGIANSGMRVAQTNLAITGHNIANGEIPGFSRQRIVQSTSFVRNIGMSSAGMPRVIGMGADWQAVQQIRNEFLDFHYRQNVGRLQFYSTIAQVGMMIESSLGELYGADNFQHVLNTVWNSIQELTANPEDIATRQMLLANANAFLNKAQSVQQSLYENQLNLDAQIREMVNGENGINNTVARINHLNELIRAAQAAGDNANDFMDERNRALDRLAEMIPIDVTFCRMGDANITSMGHQILTQGHQNMMGLRFVSNNHSFVEPVFTRSTQILSAGTPTTEFEPFMNYRRGISDAKGNDFGGLMALMLARGNTVAHMFSAETPPPTAPTSVAPIMPVQPTTPVAPVTPVAPTTPIAPATPVPPNPTDFAGEPDPIAAYEAAVLAYNAAVAAYPGLVAAYNAASAIYNNPDPNVVGSLAHYNAAMAAYPGLSAAYAAASALYNNPDPTVVGSLAHWNAAMVIFNQEMAAHNAIMNEFSADLHNWNAMMWGIQHSMIPEVQMNLDRILGTVVTMINDTLTGRLRGHDGQFLFYETDANGDPLLAEDANGDPIFMHRVTGAIVPSTDPNAIRAFVPRVPLDADGREGVPLFIRNIDDPNSPEWPFTVDPNDSRTRLTTSNLRLNPAMLEPRGHNRLAFSLSGAPSDTTLLNALTGVWMADRGPYTVRIGSSNFRVQDAYINMTGDLSARLAEANSFVGAQSVLTIQSDNQRNSVKGVAIDEELNSMLRFQHAFQASSRVFNVIDSMIDQIVNRTGRVGL